jgi:hypothetical protein
MTCAGGGKRLGVSVSESANYAPSAAVVRRKPQLGLSTTTGGQRAASKER